MFNRLTDGAEVQVESRISGFGENILGEADGRAQAGDHKDK